jgi:hypothetical protein
MPTTKMWATSALWPALLLSLLVLAPAGAPAEEAPQHAPGRHRSAGALGLPADRSSTEDRYHQRPLAAGTPRVAPVPVT